MGTDGSRPQPVSFHSSLKQKKMAGVLLLVSEFIEDDFDVLNDIVKDDDDIVKENELFEE